MDARQKLLEAWEMQGFDRRVIAAMASVPREFFVPKALSHLAYIDEPLPIGHGQTISQPTTVLIMTQSLQLREGMKVLEVGAGSGYQAAVISEMIGKKGRVFTIEFSSELVELARANLKRAKIANVEVIQGDGGMGLPEKAPFDRILLTCATKEFPPPLVEQLKEGGIILGPIGGFGWQQLIRGKKLNGKLVLENLGDFVFVPMLGRYGLK